MPIITKTIIRRVGYLWRWRIIGWNNEQLATGIAKRQSDARQAAKKTKKVLTRKISVVEVPIENAEEA